MFLYKHIGLTVEGYEENFETYLVRWEGFVIGGVLSNTLIDVPLLKGKGVQTKII